MRDIAMTFILDRLGVQVDNEEDIPTVVVYVVSGGALTSNSEKILDGLSDLIGSVSDVDESYYWTETLGNLIQRETDIMQQVTEQQMEDVLKGDSPDYFTLWESRN